MKKIIVASKNPVKVHAVEQAFGKMFKGEDFEIVGVSVPSDVPDQPMSDEETYTGALNRVNNAQAAESDAEYWVGIEGGIEEKNAEFEAFAWVVIRSKDEKYGKGRTSTFFLPEKVATLIREGKELSHASDAVFKEDNSKQKQGTIGLLTDNHIDRTKYYTEPTIIALIPFKHPDLYF
ncbi:inosine/xanthosine triphosphatase [Candidatus Kaiserbacteria bacterium]|nr:MAG: inosine/xanthosine triphosphatase [Candidatus Kaiserbacteria bacterium]